MSSISYSTTRKRWIVQWVRQDGARSKRQFRDAADANAFAQAISDERNGTPGPESAEWTPDHVRSFIAANVVIDSNGCWIWQLKGGSNGYANATHRVGGKPISESMHRRSYEAHVGPILDGLQIDHLCFVTKCVNPGHLEPVTQAENLCRRNVRQAVA